MNSNLALVNEADSYPYTVEDASERPYTLIWQKEDGTSYPIGYTLESVVNELFSTEDQRSKAVAATLKYWRDRETFGVLKGWRDEVFPVYDATSTDVLFSIERSESVLFGIVTAGVHMTGYVRDPEASQGLKLWVARRAASKQPYPLKLDSTIAGGLPTGEDPFECMMRECIEEAGLDERFVRYRAGFQDMLTYFHISISESLYDMAGLSLPVVSYVYGMELPIGLQLKPNDNEVDSFNLWTVEEVKEHLAAGEFAWEPSMAMLSFLITHWILTAENEKDFEEITRRLHRKLDFPGPHRRHLN